MHTPSPYNEQHSLHHASLERDTLESFLIERANALSLRDLRNIIDNLRDTDGFGLGHQQLQLSRVKWDYGDLAFMYGLIARVVKQKEGDPDSLYLQQDPWKSEALRGKDLDAIEKAANGAIEAAKVKQEEVRIRNLKALTLFRLFCSERTRFDVVDLAIAEIQRTIREARADGRGRLTLSMLVCWHSASCMCSVVADGACRSLCRFDAIARIIGQLKPSK